MLEDFQETYEELLQALVNLDVYNYDCFADLKLKIDLHREELKYKIEKNELIVSDLTSDKLIKKIENVYFSMIDQIEE